MDNAPIYQLIHAVDPTKIKVPIRDKFAKLTLSSNKKKKEEPLKEQQQSVEKRQSASRNLLDELTATQTQHTDSISIKCMNPIFRSDSFSHSESEENNIDEPKDHVEIDTNPVAMEESEFMERLQISADLTRDQLDFEEQLETITKTVSKLDVDGPGNLLSLGENVQDLTQLISTESQKRVSSGRLVENVVQRPIKCEVQQNLSICISSSDDENNEIITDDEDDDTEDDPITISDSSAAEEPIFDYEIVTSNIPATGETGELVLPDTFSNDKADRLEAFLRDVSFERKQMEKNGFRISGTQSNENIPATTEIQRKVLATDLAAADTESMSADPEIVLDESNTRKELTEREKRLLALDDTVAMSMTHASVFETEAQVQTEQHSTITRPEKCMAHDETEANTLISEDLSSSSVHGKSVRRSNRSSSGLSTSFKSAVPEDSVLIPETSSEHDDDNGNETRLSTPSNEVVPSEHKLSDNNTPSQSPLSQIQIGMASINISAKINIKIQISHQESSSDEYEQSAESESGGNSNEDDDNAPRPSLPTSIESGSVENNQCQQRVQALPQEKDVNHEKLKDDTKSDDSGSEGEDKQFLTQAQTLLNQLYGKSWQTPDVIKTLKRTSKSTGKSAERKDRLTPKGTSDKEITPKSHQPAVVEESILDDFSIFRRNIVKTNLDSTRLAITPINPKRTTATTTEPRTRTLKPGPISKTPSNMNHKFKVPQTEFRPKRVASNAKPKQTNERWRNLLDNDTDSEEVNASDDEDIDCTDNDNSSGNESRHSWSNNDLSESESDMEIKNTATRRTRATRNTRTKDNIRQSKPQRKTKTKDEIVYLDLSKLEVSVAEGTPPSSPPANHDENFNNRLEEILRTCRPAVKPKLPATPINTTSKPKRKLFTPCFGEEDDLPLGTTKTPESRINRNGNNDELIQDLENINLNEQTMPWKLQIFNKQLEAIKTGKPIFSLTPPRTQRTPSKETPTPATRPKSCTPTSTKTTKAKPANKPKALSNLCDTPNFKYGFLKSLDVCVSKSFCHPDALIYRDQYNKKKEELAKMLYDLYNEKLFNNALSVPLVWHKKLSSTAGRCLNKKKMGTRSSVIELSEKVLTSADRLRCTLIHELCHAATWIFNGEGGHGQTWKQWARRANEVFPELPKIGVCHQYDIEYKYTYKCTLCGAKSHAHSKSKKVENIRCSYCHGAIEIFINKKDKEGNILPTPVKEPTGFAKFVKDNYKKYKKPDLKHADVMKLLSNEFAILKVGG